MGTEAPTNAKVTILTIAGVPEFRFDLARKSRQRMERARAQVPEGDDLCMWLLVDKTGKEPAREFFFSRERSGWISGEKAFGAIAHERNPAKPHTFKRKDGTEFTACEFRYALHFQTFDLYKPKTQSELDAMAARREAKAEAKRAKAEREAAPLFVGGAA